MLLELTDDQEFFRDNTAKFLREQVPPAELRRLRGESRGFGVDYWRRGAELGWTSLLAPEDQGGGIIGDSGLEDLSLIAHEFGRHAAPGPLIPTNVVIAMLSRNPVDTRAGLLQSLIAGTSTAAWCVSEPNPKSTAAAPAVSVEVDGSEVIVQGTKRPVEAVGTAESLLVTGRTGAGVSQVLVPRDADGVQVRALTSIDVTRRYGVVEFDQVRLPASALVGVAGQAHEDVEHGRNIAIVTGCAESVGALQAAFEMTLAWAFDRYSFGRPLASYQELKHRFADMKAWLEASHAITDKATAAVAADSADAAELVSAAKAYVGGHGGELMQDCVQIFGGIGVTFEHDLHLFARRAAANRSNFGTPAEHRQQLADIVERQEVSA
ncbi:alkylation response protein AidB-like acyl-CoA dehydrogenase [Williamsia limnetica]|uniref:Alkylation response protein AidB-like acyl-CoA dehydrogenase n=1 Tax=Williamsia limnetica TaxID=882452 RepID=A0A318RUX1_WILLI|nr:acyl-CoA dehydrogenase family protein [Williamsia limnetica]PYE21095.1 alkylation response protein AidB-like acyl-CoA dehydrogenase [Williamsia limnetica]